MSEGADKPTGFLYLATPYTRHPRGFDHAYQDACDMVAIFIAEKLIPFSPISHSHGVARRANLQTDYKTWQRFNHVMLAASKGLIVGCFDGWELSLGILDEIGFARRIGLPVLFWKPGTPPPGNPQPPTP